MPLDINGHWYPNLSEKQLDILNCTKRVTLVCGPRKSSKTRGILHKILRHMWEVDGALVAMFSRTMKNSKDGGPWRILHKQTIPEWVKAKIGFKYTTFTQEKTPGFKVDGQTRTPYFRIRNRYGGESECMLFSLDNDSEIEDKLKEMEFTMIYFSELDKFRDRRVLSVGLMSLRSANVPYDKMQWIADCNPSEDGESSWIYKVFYKERIQTHDEYKAESVRMGLHVLPPEQFAAFQNELDLIEVRLDDNPFLDPREKEEIKFTYSYDQGLYARYVLGKWVYGDGDQSRHFRGVFNPAFHVLGDCSTVEREDWILPLPSADGDIVLCFDMGDVNHAGCILDERFIGGRPTFVMLDELVSLGKEVSNEEYIANGIMPQVEALEEQAGRKFQLVKNWADSSMLDKFSSAGGGTYQADEVELASGGRIQLMGIKKGPGSVRARVQLVKKLLNQKRLLIGAHCIHTIQMLRDLKKGDGLDFVVRSDSNKHIFDAMSYGLLGECGDEARSVSTGQRTSLILQVG